MRTQAEIEQRRKEVYNMVIKKGAKIETVAKSMNVSEKTIQTDLKKINEKMASEMLEIGSEQLLISVVNSRMEQKQRLLDQINNGSLKDTARAKYESLLMENDDRLIKTYDKLATISKKMQDHTLEDHIASMSFVKFNEMIGLPIHPYDLLPCSITQAQIKVFESVNPSKRSWICLNKSRQCGFSEVVLRILAYYAFSKYRGKKIAIVTGTRIETTYEIFERLKKLFRPIQETIALSAKDELKLKNGTSFHVVPASKHAINGWTTYGAFLLDESAFWNLEEDRVILNSFLPIARTNRSDIYMISNPNGPRGFFYHIIDSPSPSWTKLEMTIHEAGKELYTKEQIEEMINSSDEDPASSYLCKFVGGRDSVLGDLEPEDISTIHEAVSFD